MGPEYSQLLPTLGVLYSEVILSLYPILIKTVPTNLFSQYLARFLVFPALAIVVGGLGDFWKAWGNPAAALQSILLGGLNLAHIGCSYYAFANLLPGVAVSLFYLYPIFNILAGRLFFGEKLTSWVIPILGLAFLGTVLLAQSAMDTQDSPGTGTGTGTNFLAIAAAIGAALTETAIFVFVKMYPRESPYYAVQSLYPTGLAALGLASILNKNQAPFNLDFSMKNWKWLLGFNALLGFTGYTSRFYSMPRLSSAIFSILSFVGVLASFLWGVVFLGQKPTQGGLIGGMLIAFAIFLLRTTSIL
ncbi:MAG: DMT family transporter [Actinobacteria bacterium]|nr:DMT family transporter [Actinomycetota bacterium]